MVRGRDALLPVRGLKSAMYASYMGSSSYLSASTDSRKRLNAGGHADPHSVSALVSIFFLHT